MPASARFQPARRRPSGRAPAPPLAAGPARSEALIGRDALLDRLCSGAPAALALVGPAGVGKTRLSLEMARRDRAVGRQTHVVDVGAARSGPEVARAVAVALDIPVRGLVGALGRGGPVRLVLDGADEVLGPAAAMASEWLEKAAGLSVWMTSRVEPLDEALPLVRLDPLSLLAPAGVLSDAERLFEECAAAVRPGYRILSATDRDAVRALVRRLGGLPLAIEIAASWMGVMGPAQILARLGAEVALHEVGDGDRCLDDVLRTAYEALGPAERRALAQLSCFRGGFDLEAAEAVLRVPASAGDGEAGLVESLRRRSMVHAAPEPGLPGRVRLSLLSPIRHFAAARLAETGERAVEERHALYYADAADRWREEAGGVATPALHRRLLTELDNLRAAHVHALGRGDAATAARAALGLAPVHKVGGIAAILVEQLDGALAAGDLDPALGARALQARGVAKMELGRPAEAREDLTAALRGLPSGEADDVRASVLNNLGLTAWLLGDAADARARFEEGLALDPPVGLRGRLLGNLGIALCQLGEPVAADGAYRDAARCHRRAGNLASEGIVLESRGQLALRRGEPELGLGLLGRALQVHRQQGDLRHQGTTLGLLGLSHQELGRLDEAERCYREALDCQRRAGNEQYEGIAIGLLGDLARERGELDEAAARFSEAVDLACTTEDAWAAALFGASLASVLAAANRTDAATRALEAARSCADVQADRALGLTLRLAEAQLELALSPAAAPRVRDILARVEAEAAPDSRPAFLRLALRALQRHLDASGAAAHRLVVDPDARCFRLDAEPEVSLARKALLRRILLRLIEERRRRPGQSLSVDALREAGWPGERALPDAAKNRVYVAVATLRRLGLSGALVTGGDGYLIDPSVQVVEA